MIVLSIRRLLLVFIFSAFFSLNLSAQKTFGIKGGVNFSDFYDHPESEFITGLEVGIFNDFFIGKSFILSLGLNYSEEGAKVNNIVVYSGDSYHKGDLKAKRSYFEIPLYIGYKIMLSSSFDMKPNIGLNYTIGYFTDNSEFSNLNIINEDEYDLIYYSDDPSTEQKLGMLLGSEFIYNNSIILDLNYNVFFDPVMGISDLTGLDYRTHYINISIGLFIL